MPRPNEKARKAKAVDPIKVVVRSRPLNQAEVEAKTPSLVSCDPERKQVHVNMGHGVKSRGKKTYNFDKVYTDWGMKQTVG